MIDFIKYEQVFIIDYVVPYLCNLRLKHICCKATNEPQAWTNYCKWDKLNTEKIKGLYKDILKYLTSLGNGFHLFAV